MGRRPYTKVWIVDRHRLVREALHFLLVQEKIDVVGEADLSEEAIYEYKLYYPAVILLGIELHDDFAPVFISRIKRRYPDAKILVVSNCWYQKHIRALLRLGISGYLIRKTSVDELIKALSVLSRGQRYISPEIANEIVLKNFSPDDENHFALLSEGELAVAKLILSGWDTREIADHMGVTPKTVNTYRYRIYNKLKVDTDLKLLHSALRHGIIDIKSANFHRYKRSEEN